MLYFDQLTPLLLSLTPSLLPPIIWQLSAYMVMSSTCTDVQYFNIVETDFALTFTKDF
jgi:hypothetical protein